MDNQTKIEHETPLKKLKGLWCNYLTASASEYKKHWLQHFLFELQFLDEQTLQDEHFKCFFNPIPEELCTYFLELVLRIINESKQLPQINDQTTTKNHVHAHKCEETIKQMHKQHNFGQLTLTPNECNKIVALRTFLTHDLGQHMLSFLLRVDFKLIASLRSLCQLCINLFPNCKWNKETVELHNNTSITEFITNFNLISQNVLETTQQQMHLQNHTQQSQLLQIISTPALDYDNFKNTTKTSDEIALLLIQLLTKCVQTERQAILSLHSLSILVHNFALSAMCAIFESAENAHDNDKIIKFELLQLITRCVNNFFYNEENLNTLDFNSSINQLLYAVVCNRQHIQLVYALLYIIFGMLHNLVELLSQQTRRSTQSCTSIYSLDMLDKQTYEACFVLLYELLNANNSDDPYSTQLLFTQFYKVLLRLTNNLTRYERQLMTAANSNTLGNGVHSQRKQSRRKRLIAKQYHCASQSRRQFFGCYFQGKLYQLLPRISTELQEYTMRCLMRTGSCCCHYNISNYDTCLQLASHIGTSYQKYTYKFLHKHVLNTLFSRSVIATHSSNQPEIQCLACDEKTKSPNFYSDLLKLYKCSYKSIPDNEFLTLLLFLKHLKHIAQLLVHDLAAGIIAEVVLPIFRANKLIVMQKTTSPIVSKCPKLQLTLSTDTEQHDSLRILNECLSIFVIYLNDIRLIKAFYNEENIKHMEDLLSVPELQRGICNLIKVGIDNITFLGDNSHEQISLSHRLITLQLNNSDRAAQLFHALLTRCLSSESQTTTTTKKLCLDESTRAELSLLGHKPVDILYITALQWTLNYELLKTSQLFYNEFAKIYSIVVEPEDEDELSGHVAQCDDTNKPIIKTYNLKHGDKTIIDILRLNYNALNCFLMRPKTVTTAITQTTKNVEVNKESHTNSLETLVSSAINGSIQVAPLSLSSLAASTLSTSTLNSFDYTSVTTHYLAEHTNDTFLQRLQSKQDKSTAVLFDIRNQSIPEALKLNRDATQTVTEPSTSIIGKLFSMVGSFFVNNNSDKNSSINSQSLLTEIDTDLFCLYEPNGECKKLLLKLFEATMAICIKGYQNEEVEKMQKHLRKLKAIILGNAKENWQEYAEQNARDNTIIQTLQTLLKIAELSNTLTEPAGIVNSSLLAEDASAKTSPTALRARTRSFSSGCTLTHPTTQLPSKNALATPPTPQHRPKSGESVDADYFSTRDSFVCPNSEFEFSENENDYYLTADEGYEADGEIPEITESDCDIPTGICTMGGDMWNSLQPTSRYRTHVMHDGLCRLVIEILIELCENCIHNPIGWADSLAQLANRLFVIRDCLGDSLFLLKGFMPILSCNDTRLKELQQSLLELLTNLNTPNMLSTYFSILATKNPPVDILMKYMHYLATNSLKNAQPCVELEFPVTIDGKCISTAELKITEHINRVRNYHLHCRTITPFTRSPCIIPVTHTRLWHNDGITLSLWFEIKSQCTLRNSMQFNDDDTRYSNEDLTKTHIISLGTNQAILSIYVNSNMQLTFEMCKPNVELPNSTRTEQTTNSITTATADEPSETPNDSVMESKRSTVISKQKRSRFCKQNHIGFNVNKSSPFQVFKQTTKQVLLNSFNINFLNGHQQSGNENNSCFEVSNIELKSFRFLKNKWTHLALALDNQPDHLNLTAYIDGIEQHTLDLPFHNFRTLTRTHSFQMISMGDGAPLKCSHNNSTCTQSHSTLETSAARLNIANLILFNRKITTKSCILNLTAMGPDFTEFTQCQMTNWKPNYGYLNLTKLNSANFGNFAESMKLLQQARVLSYSARQPDIIMGYDNSLELDNAVYGRRYGLILYGELQQNELQSLQTATTLCGGLSVLLYLFARVVEICNNAFSQALALDLLLSIAHSETQLYTEFQRNDYISLIGYVIKSDRCTKDVLLLKSIMNNACTLPIIWQRGGTLQVNENTTAILVYPKLFISVLHRYSDWHRSGAEHSDVLDMLFRGILALTREKHPHRDFNMEQLLKYSLVKELLNICKVYVIESPNPVYISKDAAESFIQILSVFAGSPPAPSLLDEIMKLLLLLQKPSECYITHDRAKFSFLLTADLPKKERLTVASSLKRLEFRQNNLHMCPGYAVSVANNNALDIDFSRLERLKLHEVRPQYKCPLNEFEENLDSVADCSKLNKPALRLLSPVEAKRWRVKFKRHISCRVCNDRKSNSPKKTTYPRLRLCALNSSKHTQPTSQISKHSVHSLIAASLITFGSDSLGTDHTTSLKRRAKLLQKIDFYSSLGIVTLQEGLLNLLKDFLCLLPDFAVDEVLKHYVKIECLLVLANNNSCAVRSAIIKLLAALTMRLSQVELSLSVKNLFPLHLANQLSIYPSDVYMFEACLAWITGTYGNMDTFLHCDTSLRICQRFGLNALLAVTSKIHMNKIEFADQAFLVLLGMYIQNPKDHQTLIEAGILQCCIKALYNLYASALNVNYSKAEHSIVTLLATIGEKSLKSVGQINIIWDILNMLSFYQESQAPNIICSFRSAQALLQLNWINLYFVKTNVPWNFKVSTFTDSPLSVAECKTRLDMLIDRCFQFFTIYKASYTPTDNEVKLFEFLVSYGISTNQRCNNFIAWGLQPSRPRDLRAYIVDALWISCQDDFQPAIICDGKMIKALLWLSLLEDLEKPIENLPALCKYLGINENDSTWDLEHELERLEMNRCNVTSKQKSMLEKTIFKFESLAQNCIESSMLPTRCVAELQNAERKLLMSHMKDYDDTDAYTKWLEIIRRMTHEGAPWYCKERTECSWELDGTEGPSRVHTRLRRCHLEIGKRFFMENYSDSMNNEFLRPLDYLISSYDQQLNISLNSQILYNFPAKFLPVDGEIDGEIIITDHKLYFLATYRCKYFNVNCDITNITEIWLKRYQHQEKAFEIFLDTNKSLFFSLQNQDDWKIMHEVFCDKIVIAPDNSKVQLFTQQWREGLLTNWEYLMTLNQIAGRTYNDLMQYPVFPWILSNYKGNTLDLTDAGNFRKLEKPIAVQTEENEQHYINNYTYINNTITNMGSIILKPYHYSSHYSNSGTVLHFLVRVPPFTSYFLRYQDNNFDLPDRTFHALATTWSLASRDSPTDVKELIPEFFCLPEMFENFERFNFGYRQNGERVEDVLLPNWCQRDPRLFILIHRQALESEFVRYNLHHWIDLIFGFKQTGENAVDAINVFHPATYAVFLESKINDPIERKAVETMVKTYGQMPRQLFKSPHMSSKLLNYCLGDKQILESVHGLRWGVYTGSPQLPPPTLGNIYKLPGAEYLVSFNNTNVIYGLPAKSCVMQGAEPDIFNVISWGFDDRIVRIQPLNKSQAKPKNLLYNNSFDNITACGCDSNSNQLWFGHKSGRISIYKCTSVEGKQRHEKSRQSYVRGLRLSYNSAFRKIATKTASKIDTDNGDEYTHTNATTSIGNLINNDSLHRDGADLSWCGPTVLIRHTDEITCITLCTEFKIVVTAGRDGLAVIWDLNDWSYVRTIERPAEIHHSPITHVAISPTLGDIITVHTLPWLISETLDSSDSMEGKTSNAIGSNSTLSADECFEVTEETLDDFVNVNINPNGKCTLRLHSVNARYVQHIVHEDRILAVCYSYIKEGVGINVIATAIEGGIVRLWSSWNLSFVTEIVTGISNIKSICYSTHQHLVVLTRESHIQVWETEGLYGNSPKFPQIAYK